MESMKMAILHDVEGSPINLSQNSFENAISAGIYGTATGHNLAELAKQINIKDGGEVNILNGDKMDDEFQVDLEKLV